MFESDKNEIIERVKFICGLADDNADTDYISLLQDLSKKIKEAEEVQKELDKLISPFDGFLPPKEELGHILKLAFEYRKEKNENE